MYQLAHNIPSSIFRAYDIRGIVDEQLTPDVVYSIGRAFGSEALGEHQKQVVTGCDGRLSAPKLFDALCQGLMDSGCDVISVGAVPTPLLYYAAHHLETQTGVMLTGSHNPSDYNGLKMVLNNKTLTNERVQRLHQRIVEGELQQGQGSYQEFEHIDHQYIREITQSVRLQRPMRVVVDCGNGIGGAVFPQLLKALGCEVIELYCEVDGSFPNHHPDPAVVENLKDLQQAVQAYQADLGLALDGDCDRLGLISDQGEIIWPDRYLMLLAKQVLQANPGGNVIFDVKCSRHLPGVIKQYGGQPIMWKTGHSLLKMKLQEIDAPLAGELSGHVFFNDRWYGFDDALYAAVRILEAVSVMGGSLSELLSAYPNDVSTPELKLYVPESYKFDLIDKIANQAEFPGGHKTTIDGLRIDYEDGWGLVRASNTTPCLILRFEAEDESALERIKQLFREQLLGVDDQLELPF